MRVISTEVLKEDRDPKTDRALQVALAVGNAAEESCDVVVVPNLRPLWIVHLKRLAADVAFGRVVKILSLFGTHPLLRPIRPKLLHDRRLLLDENVQELGERILSDRHNRQLIIIAESRAEDGRCGAHFVKLGLGCLLCLSINQLVNGLKVRIDTNGAMVQYL